MDKLSKPAFFRRHKLTDEIFAKTTLVWEDLEKIFTHFSSLKAQLEQTAEYVINGLMKVRRVHSVRYRIKDPEHLIEKIVRKKLDNPKREITLDNYLTEITDLIGIRAIHLFKEEWLPIHNYIIRHWDLKETPTAYFRAGDTNLYTEKFKEKGCEIKEHQYGYRSIHYIIKSSPGKLTLFAEIQVRTIFEEGWSEIDHRIRYPYNVDNQIYFQFLSILNRLAGSADEMGSFIRQLQDITDEKEWDFEEKIAAKDKQIKKLEEKINKLNIQPAEKESINKALTDIASTDIIQKIDFKKIVESVYEKQQERNQRYKFGSD